MKNLFVTLLLIFPLIANAQHTFSIVAVDTFTGDIGSAGATCGDSIIWPGTPGALIISDIIPGVGAIHTQAYYISANQENAHNRMVSGDSPQEIIAWLTSNDVDFNPSIRQYGIVDYNGGSPRSAGYTGTNCNSYKNHITGSNYAIQGNILLGQQILDSMESRFINMEGCLSDKLMAALQGANVLGADKRCIPQGTSSLSAFLRVAKPTDQPDALFIDLNIAGTPQGIEPISELQTKYNNWKINNDHDCSTVSIHPELAEITDILLYPNPTDKVIQIKSPVTNINQIIITDISGKIMLSKNLPMGAGEPIQVSLDFLNNGMYIIALFDDKGVIYRKKIMLNAD